MGLYVLAFVVSVAADVLYVPCVSSVRRDLFTFLRGVFFFSSLAIGVLLRCGFLRSGFLGVGFLVIAFSFRRILLARDDVLFRIAFSGTSQNQSMYFLLLFVRRFLP